MNDSGGYRPRRSLRKQWPKEFRTKVRNQTLTSSAGLSFVYILNSSFQQPSRCSAGCPQKNPG